MKFAWIAGRFLLAGLGLFFAFVSIGSKQPDASLFASRSISRFDASENSSTDDKTAADLVKAWDKPSSCFSFLAVNTVTLSHVAVSHLLAKKAA